MEKWHYESAGQQLGPLTADEMAAAIAAGQVTAATLVWSPGMTAWRAAADTSLAGYFQPVAEEPPPLSQRAPRRPSAPGGTAPPPRALPIGAPVRAPARPLGDRRAALNDVWSWWLGCMGIALALFFCAFAALLAHVSLLAHALPLALLLFLGAVAAAVGVLVNHCRLLYRFWDCIQDGEHSTTPGLAVGLCFIPFFSLIWIFTAFGALARDLNRYTRSRAISAPRCREGLAFTICVLTVVTGLAKLWHTVDTLTHHVRHAGVEPMMLGILFLAAVNAVLTIWFFWQCLQTTSSILTWQDWRARPPTDQPQDR